ncbi:hypothetical protein SORBI_3009G148950 [Sorghum bicolor]|uniref:Uncharacterized protein n=1 Tax=Sorghum bicolor TaxID=4558 RepID=A0A1Z5R2S8_SORBI|nr:hypothetical protein SORBI_3009G148950 [Sorghum bicolor]
MERQLRFVREVGEWSCNLVVPRQHQSAMASLHPGSPGLGAHPWPMDPQPLLHLVQDMVGVYCGSSQILLAMELWLTCGWRRWASSDGRRRWNQEDLDCRVPRELACSFLIF